MTRTTSAWSWHEGEGARGRAVVTGSSSGIGAAIAHRLLRDGWEVTGVDRSPSSIDARGFAGVQLDLTDDDAVGAWLSRIGEVKALVHAAGFMSVSTLGNLDAESGAAMWRLHVDVAARLANAVAPNLPQGGRIVLIGSRTSSGAAGRSQYAATKAALVGMARSWAIELAPRGITVNVIAPAATDTPMLQDTSRDAFKPRVPPMGRLVRPDEVAALTSFILSDDAAAITGQQLVICGGSSL